VPPSAFDPTYSVSQLCGELKGLLRQAFDGVWVVGEVQRPRPSRPGHFYFELVEKEEGRGDQIIAKLDAVMWRNDFARVQRMLAQSEQRIQEGLEIRVRGSIDFWPPGGRLQLVIKEVDPVFTLGLLEKRRRETLQALTAAGLLEVNRRLPLPTLPLRLGLVTSEGSAAYHDFLSTLSESGYGFQVVFVHAAVQGKDAEREIASALRLLAGSAVDTVALIRGGGSRSDLAVFDTRRVAEAIARMPVPVLTGLGHEIDEAIADKVAHTALKTPTKAAEFLVEQIATVDHEVAELRRRLRREALEPLKAARQELNRAERELRHAGRRILQTGRRLEEIARLLARLAHGRLAVGTARTEALTRRLTGAAPRLLARRRQRPEDLLRRIVTAARGHLGEAGATLTGHGRLLKELSPQRTLERGFSITRDADGRALREPTQAPIGSTITTQLAAGEIRSRVEEEV